MTDLEAGPEMDRMIATKVMGWERGKDYGEFRWGRPFVDHSIEWWMDFDDCPFSPSTNIAHAWEVVDKMGNIVLFRGEDRWHCAEMSYDDGFGDNWIDTPISGHASADTAGLAICRCALKAIGP